MLDLDRDQLGSAQASVVSYRKQRSVPQPRQIVCARLQQPPDVDPAGLIALDVTYRPFEAQRACLRLRGPLLSANGAKPQLDQLGLGRVLEVEQVADLGNRRLVARERRGSTSLPGSRVEIVGHCLGRRWHCDPVGTPAPSVEGFNIGF